MPGASGIMQELGIDLDPDAILGRLSVADKQLVAICRALVQQAKLLIMDEPTTGSHEKGGFLLIPSGSKTPGKRHCYPFCEPQAGRGSLKFGNLHHSSERQVGNRRGHAGF